MRQKIVDQGLTTDTNSNPIYRVLLSNQKKIVGGIGRKNAKKRERRSV